MKNTRGQHARGKKITGLSFLPGSGASGSQRGGGGGGAGGAGSGGAAAAGGGGGGKLLITSNDSRVRLYDGYTLRCKYKGHTNRNTQVCGVGGVAGGQVAGCVRVQGAGVCVESVMRWGGMRRGEEGAQEQ